MGAGGHSRRLDQHLGKDSIRVELFLVLVAVAVVVDMIGTPGYYAKYRANIVETRFSSGQIPILFASTPPRDGS
jgi:hypothetical protein